jgi:hypothetical protein
MGQMEGFSWVSSPINLQTSLSRRLLPTPGILVINASMPVAAFLEKTSRRFNFIELRWMEGLARALST